MGQESLKSNETSQLSWPCLSTGVLEKMGTFHGAWLQIWLISKKLLREILRLPVEKISWLWGEKHLSQSPPNSGRCRTEQTLFCLVESLRFNILTAMFFAVAAVYRYYQGLDWLTAFLGSVSTITTIGIYTPNIVTMPDTEKILLIAVFIISVGSAASLVQSTVSTLLRREFLLQNLDEVKAKIEYNVALFYVAP